MGVSIVIGVAHSWMVDNGTYHLEMDDDWGYKISGNLHVPCRTVAMLRYKITRPTMPV